MLLDESEAKISDSHVSKHQANQAKRSYQFKYFDKKKNVYKKDQITIFPGDVSSLVIISFNINFVY